MMLHIFCKPVVESAFSFAPTCWKMEQTNQKVGSVINIFHFISLHVFADFYFKLWTSRFASFFYQDIIIVI